MQDKRDISVGVVFDYDEMQRVCHLLRAIDSALDSFSGGDGAYVDGSDSVYGLQLLLCEIIEWLAPQDAATVEGYLQKKRAEMAPQQDKTPAIQSAAPTGLRTRKADGNA